MLKEALNGRGMLETFEIYRLSNNEPERLFCGAIDSTTICNGQGPNLIAPGIAMNIDQWNPIDYFGSQSQEVSSSSDHLRIDFSQSVHAFGIDLRAYAGFPTIASVGVFGQDHITPLGTISGIELSGSGVPAFIGWTNPGGIGRVELVQLTLDGHGTYSPIVDNFEFGPAPVPEPSTVLLVATGGLAVGRAAWKGRWKRTNKGAQV